MSKKRLVVGTRSSQLALWQADFVIGELEKRYPDLEIEKRLMTTKGDKILNAPLAKIGGKGLFTKELENARVAGTMKKSQEAAVQVIAPAATLDALKAYDQAVFADLFIVSAVTFAEGEELGAIVSVAEGEKCPRCWNVTTLGGNVKYPGVCKRCGDVLELIGYVEE